MTNSKTENGFTLVEVLVAIAIIGILFFIFIPQVNSAFLKSKESGVYSDFRTFQQASESYFRETRGVDLHIDSLNNYLDAGHHVVDNGTIKQTKSKDPWKNHYEVDLQVGKIMFSSYGKDEDPTFKAYILATYLYNGKIASCTTGLGTRDIPLSIPNVGADFKCGDNLLLIAPPPSDPLHAPSNFVATNVTLTRAELSWNNVASATSYILKRDGLTIYTGSNRSFSDITLTANTTYTYSVAAKNGSTLSSFATLSVKTLNSTPPPPEPEFPALIVKSNSFNVNMQSSNISVVGIDGTLWSWGKNDYGQLGTGTSENAIIPTKIGNDADWERVDVGWDVAAGIKTDGTLWSWGDNQYGGLGVGDSVNKNAPTKVGNGTNWVNVVIDYRASYGTRSDNTSWIWGKNDDGQLGLGDNVKRHAPTKFATSTDWKELAFKDNSFVALKSDGTLWFWGDGSYFKSGLESGGSKNTPTQISTDKWKSFTMGSLNRSAIRSDGTLWSWGWNTYGYLGVGDQERRTVPTQVGTDTNWKSVITSGAHVLAIKNDGTLWAWGLNERGQLGVGDVTNRYVPTQVGTENNWKRIIVGIDNTFAFKNDGTLWAWGNNQEGQLGVGDTEWKTAPTQVGTSTDWSDIFPVGHHTFGTKDDGTLWSWGANDYGQLGHSDFIKRRVPTQVFLR